MLSGPAGAGPYARWKNGPPDDPAHFPIAVWLQIPANAPRYRAAGINCYVGLWKGPTEEQLAELRAAGMPVICAQNERGLKHRKDSTIIGWLHDDEPDNAQPLKNGKGYGPPVAPSEVVRRYNVMRAADPTRPVLLNLGQGVAWDGWYGRGTRTNRPEDYPEYAKGCDIASFDIYPAVHDHADVAGNLWYVARGVERLAGWAGEKRPVWNCIEASRIGNVDAKPTPDQVKAEVWMSIIHGSRGIIYFVHQFEPRFIEASLLEDPELLPAVTALNAQIRELAPVINAPAAAGAVTVESGAREVPIALAARRYRGATYVFAVAMRGAATTGRFSLAGGRAGGEVEVIGEDRRIEIPEGRFEDGFGPHEVHLYRVADAP